MWLRGFSTGEKTLCAAGWGARSILPLFWNQSSATKLLKWRWKESNVSNCWAHHPEGSSALLTQNKAVMANVLQRMCCLCIFLALLSEHICGLPCAPYRHLGRHFVKRLHGVQNVPEYCGTVILWLNSDLVCHDELYMKIRVCTENSKSLFIHLQMYFGFSLHFPFLAWGGFIFVFNNVKL